MTEEDISLDALGSLPGKSVVLLPNDVSARQLRDRLASCRPESDAYLVNLSAVPIEQWLVSLWDGSFPERQVLRPIQLLALAQQVVNDSEHCPADCLNITAICRQFVDAFQLFHAYQLSDAAEHYLFSAEHQAFAQWCDVLQSRLDEQDAMSSQQLPAALLALLLQDITALPLPDNVVLSDCLELTPAMAAFLRACEAHCRFYRFSDPLHPPTVTVHSYRDRYAECEAVARQISQYLDTASGGGSMGNASIAVVCTDVDSYAPALRAALRRALYPPSLFPLQQAQKGLPLCEPWVFEGNEKLLGFPSIRAAWDLISVGRGDVELEQLSRILRSRFISGWPQWRAERASLDVRWREQLTAVTTLAAALALSRRRAEAEPTMLAPLQMIADRLAALPARQLPSIWVREFDALLLAVGWPNVADDDTVVQQCRQSFSQAMDVFRALDRQLGEISHREALTWLQQILASKRFAIARDWPCPITIFNLDDAEARRYRAIWFLGADDSTLPGYAEPSAFLPLPLQILAGVPGAEPGLTLRREKEKFLRCCRSADSVFISYAREDDNAVPQEPSVFLQLFADGIARSGDSRTAALEYCAADVRSDCPEVVTAVSDSEREHLRGGTGLFKEYVVSPFFAFAKYRLRLREFPAVSEGLDYALQGMLVHASLEQFWKKTKDSASLEKLSPEQIHHCVNQCVALAFDYAEVASWRFPEALIEIEKKRINNIVSQWIMEKEVQRIYPFKVVEYEAQREASLFGIPLRLRIDRVDEIDTDTGVKRLLIDYKTGSVSGQSLNASALSEPQLPIYCLVEAGEGRRVDGVMLAQLKSVDELTLHMRSNWAASVIAKRDSKSDVATSESWQGEIQAWSTALSDIAVGILDGDIRHNAATDHRRSFSAWLLPLLRGATYADQDAAEGRE